MQCEIPKIPLYPAYTPTPDPLEWGGVGMLTTDGVGGMDGYAGDIVDLRDL